MAGRRRDRRGGAAGGGVLAAADLLLHPGQRHQFLLPASAQALNALDNDYFLPVIAGLVVFGVVAGLAAAVSKAPARWMGWVLFALGVASAVPPISFWAFLLIFLWSLTAGIWLAVQKPAQVHRSEPEVSLTAV
jgi:hypothetical protein